MSAQVVGRRSPRWAFMDQKTVIDPDGLVFLVRLQILKTPWFGIYLHDIAEPDPYCDPHDHPWTFVSIVLRGSYIETLHPFPRVTPDVTREQTWRRWSVHRMPRESAHRITYAAPGLKTLILTGPRQGEWGFYVETMRPWSRWIQWQEYQRWDELWTPS